MLFFSSKRVRQLHPVVYFKNIEVKRVCLVLDSKLTFAKHLTGRPKRVGVTFKSLDQIYIMYIRPHLDYCDIIYHIPSRTSDFDPSHSLKYLTHSLERIQYNNGLAITRTWKGTSLIREERGREGLTNRRWYRREVQFYKIKDVIPDYLNPPILPPLNHLFGHRFSNVLPNVKQTHTPIGMN